MYRPPKIHQPLLNSVPKLRPIMSAINTGMYNWAKCFVPLLKPFVSNDYKFESFSSIAKGISQQNSKSFTVFLDVDWPFTNAPIEETTEHVLRNYSRGKNGMRP